MNHNHLEHLIERNRLNLQADCTSCFGLCCLALYFAASEGFPYDKNAGEPCRNLQPDFRCGVHDDLIPLGIKGCVAFDCFGAGQKVSQVSFGGKDWRTASQIATFMCDVFLVMRQLHELLWYLAEASKLEPARAIHYELKSLLDQTDLLTHLTPDDLLELDIAAHRTEVNKLLRQASELVRTEARRSHNIAGEDQGSLDQGADLIGADLRSTDLRGADLRGAYLIAADLRETILTGTDFIGADFRDTDLRGADLSESLFLTQIQINVAKGDVNTKLPPSLTRPQQWTNLQSDQD